MTMMVPFDAFFFLAHRDSIIPTNDGVMAPSREAARSSWCAWRCGGVAARCARGCFMRRPAVSHP
jgi:hypothetical protein